ncbi:MAG: hypothetical protein AABX11_03035 [Nanoarchaeota archaeon]
MYGLVNNYIPRARNKLNSIDRAFTPKISLLPEERVVEYSVEVKETKDSLDELEMLGAARSLNRNSTIGRIAYVDCVLRKLESFVY